VPRSDFLPQRWSLWATLSARLGTQYINHLPRFHSQPWIFQGFSVRLRS
jgi:hypothetical protein